MSALPLEPPLAAGDGPLLRTIALVGNPNCGKTALFNRLTGSRQKVANYAGVTVERKEGHFAAPSGRAIRVLDLPGAYTLDASSPDEAITRDVCAGRFPGEPLPDLLVCVADATNLRLNLRFALEIKRLGRPMVMALNLIDEARRRGIRIDRAKLEAGLGFPVIETVAVRRHGADELVAHLDQPALPPLPLGGRTPVGPAADLHALVRAELAATVQRPAGAAARDEALDRVLLHPVAGLLILALLLFVMFQAVFAGAAPIMDAIKEGIASLGDQIGQHLSDGPLRGLLVDGLIAGAGSVVVFLPQILILFAFILALEESGYLPRAAFLLDRLMVGVGLSGRSFIPLLSSFACAIPGIMATRTIQNPRDRMITLMVAPLMTCSARLPVYALLIGAFVPRRLVAGLLNLQGLVLFGLYIGGVVSAAAVAWILSRARRQDGHPPLLMELPSYRLPHLRDLALGLSERAQIFLRRVGTIILALTVILWALGSWPGPPPGASEPAIYYSIAGMVGRALAVVLAPVGFNWQICVALVPGMAAREVAVAALGTVYALSAQGSDANAQLLPILAAQWAPATGFALLAWYVYAPQCLATLAVIRRETNSPGAMWLAAGYLTGLAYAASFITYRIALVLS